MWIKTDLAQVHITFWFTRKLTWYQALVDKKVSNLSCHITLWCVWAANALLAPTHSKLTTFKGKWMRSIVISVNNLIKRSNICQIKQETVGTNKCSRIDPAFRFSHHCQLFPWGAVQLHNIVVWTAVKSWTMANLKYPTCICTFISEIFGTGYLGKKKSIA